MLSVIDFARRLESGELSPLRAIEICAEAIAKHEADIGAFVTLNLEGARKAAAAGRLDSTPLRGMPVALKDIFDTFDMPTEYGSKLYAGHQPKTDASLVTLIRRTGGIPMGKTVTTEFAHLEPGKTRNPHNLAHTPGGSSSGSAAAIAAGFVPLATGSQTGGSVIRPASFCGVTGFKPSYRLLPTVGMKCVSWHLDTAGLFAASVADVAFAVAAISGRDLRVDRNSPAAPRIGVLRQVPWPEASSDMMAAIDRTVRAASAAGAKIEDIRLTDTVAAAFQAHSIIQAYEAAQSLAPEYDLAATAPNLIGNGIRQLIEQGMSITIETYDAARRTTRHARRALADTISGIDVLLSPSAPGAAPIGLTTTGSSTFNRLWTLMGTPCVNVPGLADASGLPLGMQLIGRFGDDRRTLEAALFVESAIARMDR